MAKNVQLTVDIKGGDSVGKAAEKTKTLKTQLRELKAELASGNLTGKAFDEAAARAGKLQDAIGDVNQRVKNLASDTSKLDGFVSLATGITGGFAAAQGAMALFGSENEDLQKSLVKIQGAVALLNGVQAVANALNKDSAAMTQLNIVRTKIMTFVQARYAAVVGTTTGAMKAMRIVGMTLGIGVIVAAVGLLIANFDKVKSVVMGVVDRFKGLSGTTKNILSVMFPFIGVIRLVYAGLEKLGAFAETAADRYEKLEKANQKQGKQMQREIDLMEAQGASARDLYLAKHRQLMLDYETMEAKRKLIGLTTEEKEAQKDLANSINILNAQETKRQNDDAKKRQEDIKKQKEDANKRAAERKKEQDRINAEREKEKQQALKRSKNDIKDQLKRFEDEQAKIKQAKLDAEFELEDAKDKQIQIDKQRADDLNQQIIDGELALQDAKIGIANQTADLLGQLAGKNKAIALTALAIEKGAAIADVIIKGIRERAGITARYSLAPPGAAAPELIASRIRTGLSVATIAATGIQGAKNIGGSGTGGGGGSVQPPNIRGSQTTNEPTSQPATKVFVTETDIRSVTRKVDGIFTQATIQ
jgi:hypothetical protein